ncbi:hypothetical protein N431DRAFT_434702 [Stipitochalara longipes BDJ]|nr:hypothetical protein N431DRAFT_434702 [Stipitochalara longipes BDJ]
MGHIYSKAKQVIIELGISDDVDSFAPASHINEPDGQRTGTPGGRARTAIAFLHKALQQENPERWLIEATVTNPAFLEEWISVVMLINRFYWIRIWIIQEVGLAKKLKVGCGRGTVEWDGLCLVHRVWYGFSRVIETTTYRDILDWYIEVQSHWDDFEWSRRMTIKIASYQGRLQAIRMLQPRSVGPWFLEDNLRVR